MTRRTGSYASSATEPSRPASGPRTWPTSTIGVSPAALSNLRRLQARARPVTIPSRRVCCDTLVARNYRWKDDGRHCREGKSVGLPGSRTPSRTWRQRGHGDAPARGGDARLLRRHRVYRRAYGPRGTPFRRRADSGRRGPDLLGSPLRPRYQRHRAGRLRVQREDPARAARTIQNLFPTGRTSGRDLGPGWRTRTWRARGGWPEPAGG